LRRLRNPYYQVAARLQEWHPPGFDNLPGKEYFAGRKNWMMTLLYGRSRQIPYTAQPPDFMQIPKGWETLPFFPARELLTVKYAWAIPNAAAIRTIAKLSPIVEVGAGSGYWAWMLRQAGATVYAYDPRIMHARSRIRTEGGWLPAKTWIKDIKRMHGVPAARRHPDATLLICWPSYANNWALDTLRAYRGNTVVYVGERGGGCTATDGFHDLLAREWKLIKDIDIPQWHGIHDDVGIYRRRHLVKSSGKFNHLRRPDARPDPEVPAVPQSPDPRPAGGDLALTADGAVVQVFNVQQPDDHRGGDDAEAARV
jgi:hypothetical protein